VSWSCGEDGALGLDEVCSHLELSGLLTTDVGGVVATSRVPVAGLHAQADAPAPPLRTVRPAGLATRPDRSAGRARAGRPAGR
jgi:hypothetical protein